MPDAEREDSLPNIGNSALRALARAGITRLSQVARRSQAELSQLHGVGPKALGILETSLAERGLSFKEQGT
ncbi:Helix-hairpin-helix domain-containing protein [Stigmatella erecta]|uniref:Helix-hairpin-helix domain-containing protein n=1 Tax=Stigmatella erecta TaxID=83460 RepID=A0A1I0FM04_9BACT|nr:helix-hairpin-helix domain-containing protein [Stigmatella erecta]SET59084.1 Helix-hairpin-helix domain-containing protein [Stigmatella erecta]